MNYDEVVKAARACIGDSCKVCSVCNGMGCRNRIPGPGAKGVGGYRRTQLSEMAGDPREHGHAA